MDSKKQMVIIDNKIETKNILLCEFNEQSSKWSIKYVNSNKLYYFSKNRIFLLQNPKILTENDYYFYLDNKLNNEIKEIYEFEGSDKFYYHVIFKNDKNFDCDDKRLKKICKNSYNFIEYMKKVSEVTSLKKDNGEKLLCKSMNKVNVSDLDSALANYLGLSKNLIKENNMEILIFPFGCNSSQYAAVKNAIYNKISVIEGPPGTGKTQTILNIIANIIIRNMNCQVASNNNPAIRNILEKLEKYDIIITSYDLLKRDIEAYKQKAYTFKFAITDEAQYLKNSNTQNAKAVKQIKAQTKYALTGTPIENSLAELWSIFDFIMPGYLFRYKKFKNTYEGPIVKENDEIAMKKLKMLIEPFVLRRTKKEVLTELPEKTITILNNEMNDEQKNIYLSYLAQAKEEVAEEININGIERSQIKILSALTRLRQICCHPKIFIENYEGTSSKLEQCMEIVEDATESGHKILIFSTYTSMFEIMEQQLKEQKIPYYKLTGSTKVDERIKMVDEFNTNQNIKVFLISLKAGGTGLNLTGADMVIHYDPWWNLSAENQATDRAYRIGQKNNVQVYKLITKNSIEEKIYELQMKKAELSENMLSTQTKFINKLSKDEIMKLFS